MIGYPSLTFQAMANNTACDGTCHACAASGDRPRSKPACLELSKRLPFFHRDRIQYRKRALDELFSKVPG